jgi:voltage-gated potassium channel
VNTTKSFRHLKIAVILVLGVLVLGTIGYMQIEQLSFIDALYTTIDMMATVGNVVHTLSPAGRVFTIGVLVLGVGSMLYAFGVGMEFIIEGHLNQTIRRRFMDNKIAALRNHYIICGFGRVGSRIADDYAAARIPFVVIDEKESNVQVCVEHGYLALLGDATNDELLKRAGVERAKGLLVATEDDAHNIYITLSARHLNRGLFIVARANHTETEEKLKLAGADRVHSPYSMSGHRMANLALQPAVVEFFDTITKVGNVELAVQEVAVAATSPLVGKTMVDAQNTLSDGTMIVASKKPTGLMTGSRSEVHIGAGDTIIVVGPPEQLVAFKKKNGVQQESTR